jgi:hypothetical protein
MVQVLFIILAVMAAIFFIWRMKVDPLAVAFGASIIYFLPGFLGVAQFSYGEGLESYSEPIVPGAYEAMAQVLAALTAAALVVDRVPIRPRIRIGFDAKIPIVLLAFAIAAGAASIHNTGVYFLCLDKTIALSKIDVWYYYASFSIPFAIVAGFSLRRWPVVAAGSLCLLADLYAGFRLTTAITFLASAMLMEDWLHQGWRRIVAFAAIIIVGGAAFFMVKHLIVPAKYATASYCDAQIALDAQVARDAQIARGDQSSRDTKSAAEQNLDGAANSPERRWEGNTATDRDAARPPLTMNENLSATAGNLSHSRFYFSAFVMQSEAFVTQSILNEVVRQDFHTDAGYLIGQILTGLPLGASLFGIDSSRVVSFNTMAQPALFPRVGFGMANNPWAQAYAAGGEWMVAIFALSYAAVMGVLSLLFHKTAGSLRAAFAVIGAWIGFYFHRNDLFIEIILIKQVVYVCGASILVAAAWDWMMPAGKQAQQRGRTTQ